MTEKSRIKKILAVFFAVVTVVVSVLAVNAAPTQSKNVDTQPQTEVTTQPSDSNVSSFFHEASGTLIISGTGTLDGMYPLNYDREWPWQVPDGYDTTVKHLVIDKGITQISNSFNGMQSLESVSLPEGITNIYDSFMECTALKSIDFPESLKKIEGFSFDSCSALTSITFKKKIDIDGGYSGTPFRACTALKEVRLPGGSTLYSAFAGCSSLENVYIGREGLTVYNSYPSDEIEEISVDCFKNCHKNLKLHYVEGTLKCDSDAVCWDRVLIENMPDKIALTVTTKGINVNWNGKTGANVYHLYRKAKGDKSWTKIADTKLTYYDDNKVKSGVEYSYLLKADNDTDKLTSSYTRFLSTPKIKTATQTKKGIDLTWNKVSGATKYRVYRKTSTGDWVKLGDVTDTKFSDNKAKSNVRYYYTVRAFGKTGYGNVDKTYPYVIFLKSPKITSVKKVSGGVRLEWEETNAVGYYVYRKQGNEKWKTIYSVYSNHNPVFVDTTAKKGVEYKYTVRTHTLDKGEILKSEYDTWVKFKIK